MPPGSANHVAQKQYSSIRVLATDNAAFCRYGIEFDRRKVRWARRLPAAPRMRSPGGSDPGRAARVRAYPEASAITQSSILRRQRPGAGSTVMSGDQDFAGRAVPFRKCSGTSTSPGRHLKRERVASARGDRQGDTIATLVEGSSGRRSISSPIGQKPEDDGPNRRGAVTQHICGQRLRRRAQSPSHGAWPTPACRAAPLGCVEVVHRDIRDKCGATIPVGVSSSQSLRVQVGARYRDQDPDRASSRGRCLLAPGCSFLTHLVRSAHQT